MPKLKIVWVANHWEITNDAGDGREEFDVFEDPTHAFCREVVTALNNHDDLTAALTNLVAAIDGSHAQVMFAVGAAKRVLERVNGTTTEGE